MRLRSSGDAVTVLVAGPTGLVGGSLVSQLCDSPRVRRVVAFTRRPLSVDHAKLTSREVDLARLDDEAPSPADAACCALGTTIAAAGSPQAFRRVDHDFTLAFARHALQCGARHFVLVSSVGADPRSGNFYLQVKGEVEESVRALPFEALTVLRPGLLLGERRERRPAEALGRLVAPLLNPLLAGPLAKYRAVRGDHVAAAAVVAVLDPTPGITVLDVAAIERLASAR